MRNLLTPMDANSKSALTTNHHTSGTYSPELGTTVTPTVSEPPPDVSDDDITSSFSDNDAISTCDVMGTSGPAVASVAEQRDDGNTLSGEEVCAFTTDAMVTQERCPTPPDPITAAAASTSLPQRSNIDDVLNGDDAAIVRVQHRDACCVAGSEVKVTIIPVADLAKDPPSLTQAKVEAVAVAHHYYNQWARAPRSSEDADGDVVMNNTRRQASTRTFTATGSLKFYTLMNAIARDKRSPIQNMSDLFQTTFPSTTAPEAAPVGDSDRSDYWAVWDKSVSDTFLTRSEVNKPPGPGSECRRDSEQAFPPIVDPRARTVSIAGTGNGKDTGCFPSHQFITSSTTSPDRGYLRSSVCCGRLLVNADGEKARAAASHNIVMPLSRGKSWCQHSSSSMPAVSHSAPGLPRPQQTALSMRTASLLFSSAVDMRGEQCSQAIHKHPRGLFIKARGNSEVKEGLAGRDKDRRRTTGEGGGNEVGETRVREVTRVEFVDFTDVSSPTAAASDMGNDLKARASGAEMRSARTSGRLFGNGGGQRGHSPESCERLNVRHLMTVGMTLPIHASSD